MNDTINIKKALQWSVCATAVITAIFLMTTSIRKIVFALLLAGIILFAIKALVGYILKDKNKKLNAAVSLLMTAVNILVLVAVCVYVVAPMLLFYPNSHEETYNQLLEIEAAEELTFSGDNGTVSGWLFHNADDNAPLLLYFGGNGECASRRVYQIISNEDLTNAIGGYNFAYLDYPSYGKSEGTASENTFKQFGVDVYDYFANTCGVENIYVFGYSIGTGVANYVASQRDVDGLILFAPYANGYDLFNHHLNFFHGPLRVLVEFKMEAELFAQDISVKPLILATENDAEVPYESSQRLSGIYKSGSDLITIDGIDHNGFWGSKDVAAVLMKYLQEAN